MANLDWSAGPYQLAGKRVFIAGHRGMVGGALVRRLATENCEIMTADKAALDLKNQAAVERWFAAKKPQAVFLAAAKVGGIHANNVYRADFIYDNLMIAANVIEAAHRHDVEKLLFLGSSCIYPRLARQPMTEDQLLTGALEETNEPYAIAKIAGIKLAESYRRQHRRDFISVMPTNLYGIGDNYHPENSHVGAALIRRFHEAKLASAPKTIVWGTGTPRREFMYVDDFADACVLVMKTHSAAGFINIGVGHDITIRELAMTIAEVVGYRGELQFDASRPDGTPQKLLDVSKLAALGFQAATPLRHGLQIAYADFVARDA